MKLTKHAKRQAQRRGIETDALELVLAHGEELPAARGCLVVRIPKRELPYLAAECPPMLWRRYRDRIRKVATIVDPSGDTVLTAMHRFRPLWRRF